jgi:serine/threonine protein kinase
MALEYLHDKNVTHRDIKLENIIIDKRDHIKLIDFGFCCHSASDQKLRVFCGTPSYMCPEIVQRRDYLGPPTDIWATGILFYAMLCGKFPFKGADSKDLYKMISRGVYSFPEGNKTSSEGRQFLLKLLAVNPAGRFKASQLLSDPYMKSVNIRREGSIGSDFLSTNESSNIISQTLAAGGNIGVIKGNHKELPQSWNKGLFNDSG